MVKGGEISGLGGGWLEQPRRWRSAQWRGLFPWEPPRAARRAQSRGAGAELGHCLGGRLDRAGGQVVHDHVDAVVHSHLVDQVGLLRPVELAAAAHLVGVRVRVRVRGAQPVRTVRSSDLPNPNPNPNREPDSNSEPEPEPEPAPAPEPNPNQASSSMSGASTLDSDLPMRISLAPALVLALALALALGLTLPNHSSV